jgi:NAD-dependent dihydropyrimidine dehydrogenase PreA subunit
MLDMTQTIEAKSDQLNAIDLVGGPATLNITNVKLVAGDQPVHIHYEGCGQRVYKPCKSMCRVLVMAWGKDGEKYIGRSLVVYNDPSVRWANSEVGGIRIQKMSHIDKPIRMMLTITRGKKAPFTVEPLQLVAGPPLSAENAELWKAEIDRATNMAELSDVAAKIKSNNYAESAEKAGLMQHYQSAVAKIRNQDAEPAETDPSKMDYPPEETSEPGSLEGEIPGL